MRRHLFEALFVAALAAAPFLFLKLAPEPETDMAIVKANKTTPLVDTDGTTGGHMNLVSPVVDGVAGKTPLDATHPLPAKAYVGAVAVAEGAPMPVQVQTGIVPVDGSHPLPVGAQMQLGTTAVDGSHPVPVQVQVSTTAVGDTAPLPAKKVVRPTTPVAHRTAKTGRDVLAAPAISAFASIDPPGAVTIRAAVIGINAHGRTVPSGISTVADSGGNERLTITPLTGAVSYDIYCSGDADPKWVGRITEAQLAAGCVISAVGVVGAGGVAGSVDIQCAGTGRAASTAAANHAYVIPADLVDCTGYEYAYFDVTMSTTGDVVAPTLTVTPFLKNSRDATWYAGTPVVLDFGGAAGHLNSLKQRLTVPVNGNAAVSLLIQDIAGTGASVNVDVSLA